MRPSATALCVLVGALGARSTLAARPGPGRVSMRVSNRTGTEQCIAQPALEQAVEARLQREVFTHDAHPPLVIELELSRTTHQEWAAKLTLTNADGQPLGQRELATRASHCSALDDSLALVVALLVDAPLDEQLRKEAGERATPAATAPSIAPLPTPRPTPLRIPARTHAPRAPWRANGHAAATLSLGSLPTAAPGLELGLELLAPSAPSFRLFAGATPSRSTPGDSGARVSLWYGGLEVRVLQLALGPIRCSAWLGETVGALRAEAFGFDENSSTTRAYFAPFLGTRLVHPVSSQLGLVLGARAEVPLT